MPSLSVNCFISSVIHVQPLQSPIDLVKAGDLQTRLIVSSFPTIRSSADLEHFLYQVLAFEAMLWPWPWGLRDSAPELEGGEVSDSSAKLLAKQFDL
jgi:hypothetical protein